jgi:hypothetical protein
MSSHHIIRDEQEPALLIMDINAIDKSVIESLLEWSPTVVVSNSAREVFLHWGYKIDYLILGKPEAHTADHPNLYGIIECYNQRNEVATGIDFLLQKGHGHVNIVGNPENFPLFAAKQYFPHHIVLFEADQKIMPIKTGLFKKWYSEGTEIAIQPLYDNTFFTVEGFIQDFENEMISQQMTLRVRESAITTIQSNLKRFLVIEQL